MTIACGAAGTCGSHRCRAEHVGPRPAIKTGTFASLTRRASVWTAFAWRRLYNLLPHLVSSSIEYVDSHAVALHEAPSGRTVYQVDDAVCLTSCRYCTCAWYAHNGTGTSEALHRGHDWALISPRSPGQRVRARPIVAGLGTAPMVRPAAASALADTRRRCAHCTAVAQSSAASHRDSASICWPWSSPRLRTSSGGWPAATRRWRRCSAGSRCRSHSAALPSKACRVYSNRGGARALP